MELKSNVKLYAIIISLSLVACLGQSTTKQKDFSDKQENVPLDTNSFTLEQPSFDVFSSNSSETEAGRDYYFKVQDVEELEALLTDQILDDNRFRSSKVSSLFGISDENFRLGGGGVSQNRNHIMSFDVLHGSNTKHYYLLFSLSSDYEDHVKITDTLSFPDNYYWTYPLYPPEENDVFVDYVATGNYRNIDGKSHDNEIDGVILEGDTSWRFIIDEIYGVTSEGRLIKVENKIGVSIFGDNYNDSVYRNDTIIFDCPQP